MRENVFAWTGPTPVAPSQPYPGFISIMRDTLGNLTVYVRDAGGSNPSSITLSSDQAVALHAAIGKAIEVVESSKINTQILAAVTALDAAKTTP